MKLLIDILVDSDNSRACVYIFGAFSSSNIILRGARELFSIFGFCFYFFVRNFSQIVAEIIAKDDKNSKKV